MSWGQSAGIAVDAINSLSPKAQRDKKWEETARGMEVQKFASTMRAQKAANEKAERENAFMGQYTKMGGVEQAFQSIKDLDPIKDAEKINAAMEGLDEGSRQALAQMQQDPKAYDSFMSKKLALGDMGNEMGYLQGDAQSTVGKLATDLRRGLISPATFDSGVKGLKQGTSEFERLLAQGVADGKMSEAEAMSMREQRLTSLIAGKKGFMITQDEDGGLTITEGMDSNTHTDRQKAKAREEFDKSSINGDKFIHLSNRFMEDAVKMPESGGVAGAVALMGNEMTAGFKNVAKLLGVGDEDGKLTESDSASLLTDDSLWGEAAGMSKIQKGRILDLAIAYAGFRGQTGRALSDTDLKLALDQIGASTNNPMTMVGSLADLQERIKADLKITAQARGYDDYKGVSQYDPKYRNYNREGLPEGAQFMGVADGFKYYIDAQGNKKKVAVQ